MYFNNTNVKFSEKTMKECYTSSTECICFFAVLLNTILHSTNFMYIVLSSECHFHRYHGYLFICTLNSKVCINKLSF